MRDSKIRGQEIVITSEDNHPEDIFHVSKMSIYYLTFIIQCTILSKRTILANKKKL